MSIKPILPIFLNSGLTIFSTSSVVTANEISVGGTLICSKVPLMESLPPIGGVSKYDDTSNAPSSDLSGFDQDFSSVNFS